MLHAQTCTYGFVLSRPARDRRLSGVQSVCWPRTQLKLAAGCPGFAGSHRRELVFGRGRPALGKKRASECLVGHGRLSGAGAKEAHIMPQCVIG